MSKPTASYMMLTAAFMLPLILSGGFYSYSSMAAGITGAVVLLYFALSGRNLRKADKRSRYLLLVPAGITVCFLIVSLWAVDKPVALEGFVRLTPVLLWIQAAYQLSEDEKASLLGTIPYAGALMVIAGVLAFLIPGVKPVLWQADRFGGTFQYSNTCALFLLLGIEVLYAAPGMKDKKKSRKHTAFRIGLTVILICGILLTGSRGILILAFIWALYKAIRVKSMRIPVLITCICITAVSIVYVFLTGNAQNVGRITTLLSHQSTIWGRLLYYKDAIRMLLRYPFGLGWQGYYYLQPVYQHGVYTTRYVHNDLLQLALDTGIIPALVMVVYLIRQLVKGKQTGLQKEMLAIMLLASLTDIHFQYLWMLMTALICLDTGNNDRKEKQKNIGGSGKKMIICAIVGAIIIFGIFAVPYVAERMHKHETVLKFLPGHTDSQLALLSEAESADKALGYAESIIRHNTHVSQAYIHLGTIAAMKGDTGRMMGYMDKAVENAGYDISVYRYYYRLLSDMLESPGLSVTQYDAVTAKRESVPVMLSELKDKTDPLAYKLRDLPVFTLE